MTRLLLMMMICCYCFNTVAQDKRDTLFLFYGQVLIGDIKDSKLGVIKIDDKDLKIVNVKAYKIKHMVSQHSIFRIETDKRQVFYSTIGRTEKPGEMVITHNNLPVIIHITDIAILTPVQENFFKRLDGTFGLGFSYSKSSNIGQINTNANVFYSAKRFQYQLTANLLASIDTSAFSRDNESVQFFANYDLPKDWFIAGQLLYQRNLELSMARRFQELIGMGNKLILKPDWQVWAVSGLSLGQEKSVEGNKKTTLEIPVMIRINFFHYEKVNIQFSSNHAAYFSLSEAGRIRYDGNFTYSHEVIHNFYVNLNFYLNYDNKPPENANSNVDYGTSLSINYRF